MITISKGAKLVTLINVFTVDPANQQRIVDLLARATERSVRYVPGSSPTSASPQPLVNYE
jgi:hypothetical protein